MQNFTILTSLIYFIAKSVRNKMYLFEKLFFIFFIFMHLFAMNPAE